MIKKRSLDLESCPEWVRGSRCAIFGVAALLGDIGVGADTAAILGPALVTGAGGALVGAATGHNPLTSALIGGGIGGIAGATGAAGALNNYLGFGAAAPAAGMSASDIAGALGTTADANGILQGGTFAGMSVTDPEVVAAAGGTSIAGPSTLASTSQALDSGTSTAALNRAAGTTASGASAATGGGKGLSNTSLLLGALAAAGALNKPKVATYPTPGPAQTAATQGPLWNQPLSSANAGTNRTAVNPFANNPNYATYGQNPNGEQMFFTGNQLTLPYGTVPAAAKGGALNKVANMPPVSTAKGDHHVRGPGGPEEDRVPARLSPGEFILDHGDVTAIGGGNNERGAAIIEKARRNKGALTRAFEQAAGHRRAA